MRYILCLGFLVMISFSCQDSQPKEEDATTTVEPVIEDSAAWLIQEAIKAQGGELLDATEVRFNFRDRAYGAKRGNAKFAYYRQFESKEGEVIKDVLTNDGLARYVEGEPIELSPKDSGSYARSVNSVVYFALLPYFLQDPAVFSSYLGQVEFEGENYHKLKVGFSEDGGGRDFDDEYVYWFKTSDFSLDYLAYNFQVDGGGARFRKAYNPRRVGGIRFVDYLNMKPQNDFRAVTSFDSLYEAGGLDSLSLIILEDVEVGPES